MISQYTLRKLPRDKVGHEFDHRRAVGPRSKDPPINTKRRPSGIDSICGVTQNTHQIPQSVNFPVDITDDVERTKRGCRSKDHSTSENYLLGIA